MRILAIRGSNLASLAGDFEVDFTAEPLVSSGIFAITGPTGAGKSTLLDTVCLALFAEIPRLRAAPASGSVGTQDNGIAARDARSILRHGAGQGHAEVDFAMPGGGHYRAHWEVRRARGKADGNLQNHSHAFERLDTGERMGGTNTETRTAIAEVIGLTADQFTRAVLLAQGDFEAFIRADANERAVLLERLTGSQIYTRIGQRAWAKAREMETELNSLRQQITGQQGLDDDTRALADAALEEAGLTHAQALVRKEALEAEEWRQARGRELLAAVEQAGEASQQAQAVHDAARPRREALVRDRTASQLLPLAAAQTAARQHLALADNHLAERSKAVEAASHSTEARMQEAEDAALALAAQEQQARQLAPALEEARSLDRQIAEASTRLEQAQQEVSRTQAEATRTSDAAASARDLHDAARARQAAAESWLETHASRRGLSEREAELTALIAGYATTQASHEAAGTALAEREEAERKALADHRAQDDGLRLVEEAGQTAAARRQQAEAALPPEGALAELTARIEGMGGAQLRAIEAAQAVRDAKRGAVGLETTRQRLQAGRLRLAEIERALADQALALAGVDARLIEARRVLAQSLAASAEAAEALRAGLVEGEPCPVCGAAEHPLSALESLLGRHLEENRAQTAALEQEWTGLRGDHQAMLREKEALTQQQAALAVEESDQLSALAGLNAASEAAGASLQQAIDALGIEAGPDLGERLSALRQTANRQRDAMQAAQAEVDSTRRAEDAARHAVEDARRGEQATRDRLRMVSEAVKEVRAALVTSAAVLAREGDALDNALAAMVDWRSLPDGASWLRTEARSWRDHAAEQVEAAQALPALAQALGEAGSARDVAAAQVRAASEAWRQRNEEATRLQEQRTALLDGRAVQDVEREIVQATDTARKAKLDAQREVGTGGTRSAARIGEERRQADNAGFAQGAGAAGTSVREAAHLDSFIQALSRTAGNQTDLEEGGAPGVADRAHNERLSRVVENERLTRMQSLLHGKGIELSRREIAMDQNGDLNLNLNPATAASMWKAGLINESQLGAVANGGRARFSFAHNDLLVSSSTGYSQSARSDTSTRFEAGKQAGPDTIEHFLSSGPQGQAMMANWLRGGFEMDRKGNWRLKPQVADTLERDVQAIMAQTGWQRSLSRSADHTASLGTSISGSISGSATRSSFTRQMKGPGNQRSAGGSATGGVDGKVGIESSDRGTTADATKASLDIVNYDVRAAISAAERQAAKSHQPAEAFARSMHDQIMSEDGLRSRYLNQADDGRGTVDLSAPITSTEQSSLLRTGRFLLDPSHGPGDGDNQTKAPK